MIHWGIWEGILPVILVMHCSAKGNEAAALPYWQADHDTSMHYHETVMQGLRFPSSAATCFIQVKGQRPLHNYTGAGDESTDPEPAPYL